MKKTPRILIADDDVAWAQELRDRLANEGSLSEVASSCEEALNSIRKLGCDVAVCDVRLNGNQPFELLDRIGALHPNLPVIIGAARSSVAEAVEAVKRGAFQYLPKPFGIDELLGFVVQATAGSLERPRTAQPRPQSSGMGACDLEQASPLMRELRDSIALVARSSTPVLVLGESGTGKERVARAIHAGGLRASRPFIALNTSAIPEQLLESEVFGHVRGAFTGATQARRGLFVEANGGTLLLDEIGDMPLMLQPKLLRVLQFGEARPVGSDRVGHVDVRVIAATHRDLGKLVREGRFREDLRYRLNVIPLLVPPLRSRKEDIPPLVARFLEEARERSLDSPVSSFSDEAMNVLTHADWVGNVRELENTVERLVVLGHEAVVTSRDLDFLRESRPEDIWLAPERSLWTLKQVNQRYLQWVLAHTHGDKARAATILNINLSTLYRWERARDHG